MKQMDVYHHLIKNKYTDIKRHMFGGYQLLQRLGRIDAEELLSSQANLWNEMKSTGDHRIHVEFADFTDMEFFKLFERYAVRNSNSLGMNEQELIMLLDFWSQDPERINAKARNSQPSFEEILDQLKEFFVKQKSMGLDINRIHLHPYGSFFMCYEKNKWNDARDAIIKSAMAIPKYCIVGPN